MTRLRRARLAGALVALGIYCYVADYSTTPRSAGCLFNVDLSDLAR
jgi:hypothetical protein